VKEHQLSTGSGQAVIYHNIHPASILPEPAQKAQDLTNSRILLTNNMHLECKLYITSDRHLPNTILLLPNVIDQTLPSPSKVNSKFRIHKSPKKEITTPRIF
jgi:hypothetical protein